MAHENEKEVYDGDALSSDQKSNYSSDRDDNFSAVSPRDPNRKKSDVSCVSPTNAKRKASFPVPKPKAQQQQQQQQQQPQKGAAGGQGQGQGPDPFATLPPHEADILRKQLDTPNVKVGFKQLFRYATKNDIIILIVASICAIGGGAALPIMTIIFGSLASTFRDFFDSAGPDGDFQSTVDGLTLYFVYIAIGEFVTIFVATMGFIYTGEHITGKIREQYLAAVLRQNIGYFDKLGVGEVTTRITNDTNLVQDGISQKMGLILTAFATFVTAYVIGFIKYWKLTLILTSTVVAVACTMFFVSRNVIKLYKKSLMAYARGGTVAEEVVSSIRTAVAFGTQDKLAAKYDVHLKNAEKVGFKLKSIAGSMMGLLMLYAYLTYALAFWLGGQYIVAGETGLSDILTTLLAIMLGAFALGNTGPSINSYSAGLAAAGKLYSTIDRVSPLDGTNDEGRKLEHLRGTVELRNVKHIYPTRPEAVVMEDVSMVAPAGKTTALVGGSGSGKSTIVGLVERFYAPIAGEVLIDGVSITDLNLRWLRQQIALVSQEPTLFATTIAGNIRHGLIGTKWEHVGEDQAQKMVEEASKMANAHDFISQLPEGYKTNVGERGFLLSGGQKQRIAIARAVISDPKILLLDEATSALDTKSEGVVQAALDKASKGRTTIVIAHRLSTIRNADNIVVMNKGVIVEQGTHDQLLEKQGAYHSLVQAQKIAAQAEKERKKSVAIAERNKSMARSERNTSMTFEGRKQSLALINAERKASMTVEGRKASLAAMHADRKKSMAAIRAANTTFFEDEEEDDDDDIKSVGSADSSVADEDLELGAKAAQPVAPPARGPPPKPFAAEAKNPSLMSLVKLVLKFNKHEWYFMSIGLFFAVVAGSVQPVQSVFFAKEIESLSLPPIEYPKLLSETSFWSFMYFMVAICICMAVLTHGISFAYCSEKLVQRVRARAFRTLMRQDIAFFDKPENTAGALTAFLSTGATEIAGMSGATLGTICQVLTTLIVGSTVSLSIGWKLALVCISTIPVVLACGFLRVRTLTNLAIRQRMAYGKSASYACEAVSGIRTVAALTREQDVWNTYHVQVEQQTTNCIRATIASSALYAASQSFNFCCIALGFWYGSTLIAAKEYSLFQFFVCLQSVVFGAQTAGILFSFAPDMGKAKNAASQMKVLFDRKIEVDTWSKAGKPVNSVQGHVEFRDVKFHYPTRPEQTILNGLDLEIKPGQFVALVGASGCGKSTTISLMERFYNPASGTILVDGQDISTLNVNEYRAHMSLVAQEPTLFQGTIRENILMGAGRAAETISEEELVRACKESNTYDFIMSLPDGFNTVVGGKGSNFSGGQKQRIAICRALIRNPRILLLDEATSALDSESEKIVQAALDKAAKGRTTISIAHRLSTIQKADIIYVFDKGSVVEQGTHQELVNLKGYYYELVNLQSLEGGA